MRPVPQSPQKGSGILNLFRQGSFSAADVEKYIGGLDFPCSKDDLIDQALSNNAPSDLLDAMERFPDTEFHSLADVARCLGAVKD